MTAHDRQKQHTVIDSPYGPLTLVADDGVLCGLYMTEQRHRPPEESFGGRDDTPFARAEPTSWRPISRAS